MADQQLTDYIKKSVLGGHSLKDVREAMLGAGWNQKEVDEAIQEARKPFVPGGSQQAKNVPSLDAKMKLAAAALAAIIALALIAYFVFLRR